MGNVKLRGSWTSLSTSLALMMGCAVDAPVEVTVQQAHAARVGAGGFVSLDLLASVEGQPIACDDGRFEVRVSVTAEGVEGHFTELPPQSWVVACDDGRTGDLSLVVDNSGSEHGFLDWLQGAAHTIADEILARGGRLSLVRVSTNSELVLPMTADEDAVGRAIDGLYVNKGWTALWDGVRLGQSSLGGSGFAASSRTDVEEFCFGEQPLGVVVFTDGIENNSADEHAEEYDRLKYPGDGIDTTLADLEHLSIGDAVTPIYTLGLGREVDAVALGELAAATGARSRVLDAAEQIPEAFSLIQKHIDATAEVCAELPQQECGDFLVRVDWTWTPSGEGSPLAGAVTEPVTYTCDEVEVSSEGRVATILMTLGDPGIPTELASTLAQQAVEWASPRLRPHVLIVLDDGNAGEDVTDVELVTWLLSDVDTLEVDYLEESAAGLSAADLDGFDVVWFANPGYPMDDLNTFQALQAFVDSGGGLVLQGDDMTWSTAGFYTTALTGLVHGDNGTSACGRSIDNRAGGTYDVDIIVEDHAITRGLAGTTFSYGNDIDLSFPLNDDVAVLATAVPRGVPTCAPRPVIVGYDPQP